VEATMKTDAKGAIHWSAHHSDGSEGQPGNRAAHLEEAQVPATPGTEVQRCVNIVGVSIPLSG